MYSRDAICFMREDLCVVDRPVCAWELVKKAYRRCARACGPFPPHNTLRGRQAALTPPLPQATVQDTIIRHQHGLALPSPWRYSSPMHLCPAAEAMMGLWLLISLLLLSLIVVVVAVTKS
ncbi:hypothetical protein E2C01_037483 [Portunus trituberculatus]|uniref:Uncharacterized protein n=1 Tax=Portunus trituberculatus TaxID=210409 RepID=A0A5B7FF28_PORTR|nr:hypothetical protein [Portunus trituberculatus]